MLGLQLNQAIMRGGNPVHIQVGALIKSNCCEGWIPRVGAN